MEKKPGSVFVFRNERAEDREAARYNCTKQKTMEILLSRIQAQIEKEEDGMVLLKLAPLILVFYCHRIGQGCLRHYYSVFNSYNIPTNYNR